MLSFSGIVVSKVEVALLQEFLIPHEQNVDILVEVLEVHIGVLLIPKDLSYFQNGAVHIHIQEVLLFVLLPSLHFHFYAFFPFDRFVLVLPPFSFVLRLKFSLRSVAFVFLCLLNCLISVSKGDLLVDSLFVFLWF